MKITIVQTDLAWENREQNLAHFRSLVTRISETQLIILPEMFTTGFTMSPEKNAEASNGEALAFLRETARSRKCTITGSVSVEDAGKYFNRLFWVSPDGAVAQYDKRHLFRLAKEDTHYCAGTKKLIVQLDGWQFCPMICYDLRFPVWSRNRFRKSGDPVNSWEYDVLIYVANWPQARINHWKHLLVARAIENQCYVVGVNRIGIDGNGYAHPGASMVINPRGEIIGTCEDHKQEIKTIVLDRNYLDGYRKIFPAGMDSDDFSITS
jgi:omega-amidase